MSNGNTAESGPNISFGAPDETKSSPKYEPGESFEAFPGTPGQEAADIIEGSIMDINGEIVGTIPGSAGESFAGAGVDAIEWVLSKGGTINPNYMAKYGNFPVSAEARDYDDDSNEITGVYLNTDQVANIDDDTTGIERTTSGVMLVESGSASNKFLGIATIRRKYDPVSFERLRIRFTELSIDEEISDDPITVLERRIRELEDQLALFGDQSDIQLYPDGTFLTIPEETWTYIMHMGKRRYIPDIYLDRSYNAAESGYTIHVSAGQGKGDKSLLDTLLNAYQGSVNVITLDELRIVPQGDVESYNANPTRDTAEIDIPNGDPDRSSFYPPEQTVNIATQKADALAIAEAEAAKAEEEADDVSSLAEANIELETINADLTAAVGAAKFNKTNTGIWKQRIASGQYQLFIQEADDKKGKGSNTYKRINEQYLGDKGSAKAAAVAAQGAVQIINAGTSAAVPTPTSIDHKIKQSQDLQEIAVEYNTTVAYIESLNPVKLNPTKNQKDGDASSYYKNERKMKKKKPMDGKTIQVPEKS